MKMIEFRFSNCQVIAFAVDHIVCVHKATDKSTEIFSNGDSDGFLIFEPYENVIKKIREA